MTASSSQSASSLSQSALIFRQFCKRKLAVAGAILILLLVVLSVFAPFIANDRPLWYRGFNRARYADAVRNLATLQDRLAAAKETERNGLRKSMVVQQEIIADSLGTEDRKRFHEWTEKFQAAAAKVPANADELRSLKVELRSSFSTEKVKLVSRSFFPVFAGLNGLELGFMALVLLALPAPLWLQWCRRLGNLRWGLLVGLPVLFGVAWWLIVPARLDRTPYKNGVLANDPASANSPVVYESVTWPVIPFGFDEIDLDRKFSPPSWLKSTEVAKPPKSPWDRPFLLGTDGNGRDLMCRMLWGARVSLSVGIVSVSIYVSLGIVIGAIAGYFRGWADLLISRIIEVVICFPAFFLILTIVAFLKPSILNIMIVIGLTGWTGVARLVRGEFLRLVDQEFVLAGRALGYSSSRLIFRHILPNAIAPVLVTATFGIAGAILTESSLSYLGFGVSVPTPSWGGIMNEGYRTWTSAPWLVHCPGIAIFLTITAYNLVGETIRDASDPRLRGALK